jgi:hypothetical protein
MCYVLVLRSEHKVSTSAPITQHLFIVHSQGVIYILCYRKVFFTLVFKFTLLAASGKPVQGASNHTS